MICPYCQKDDVKNLPSHLRFCKKAKEEKVQNITASQEEIKDILPEMISDEEKQITSDQVSEVEEFLKHEEAVAANEIPAMTTLNCTAIDFNFPDPQWKNTLEKALQLVTGDIRISLKYPLGHEYVDLGGVYIYPSDVFYTILRNYCSTIDVDSDGKVFTCKTKV